MQKKTPHPLLPHLLATLLALASTGEANALAPSDLTPEDIQGLLAASGPATRDFGPVAATPAETVRLVVKKTSGPPQTCTGRLYLSASPELTPLSIRFNLGGKRLLGSLDIDPAQYGAAPTARQVYAVTAQVKFDPLPATGGIPGLATTGGAAGLAVANEDCEKRVSAAVLILDRATGAVKRADDTYDAIQ